MGTHPFLELEPDPTKLVFEPDRPDSRLSITKESLVLQPAAPLTSWIIPEELAVFFASRVAVTIASIHWPGYIARWLPTIPLLTELNVEQLR